MKFLAILRDSLREALDAKVIYFLFGLSALTILLVASISFEAEPADKGLRKIFDRFPNAQTVASRSSDEQPEEEKFGPRRRAPLHISLENFKQTNDTPFAYKGEYSYELVITEVPFAPPPEKEGDGEGEGEEEGKDKKKENKPRKEKKGPFAKDKPPSVLRSTILASTLFGTPEEELSEEDRALKGRIFSIGMQAAMSGGKLNPKQRDEFEAMFRRQIERIGTERIEQWVSKQMVTTGALEVTSLKLTEEKEGTFTFLVECKAGADTIRTWPHTMSLFFGALKLPIGVGVGIIIYAIEDFLVAGVGAGLTMLLSTIITAFFIPNMLRKGTVDLLISKPISRTTLLISKYIGGLTFMFLNTVVIVVGIWLVLGLRSGLWGTGFLLSIFVLTFQFAIFYALSLFLGVLTRSPIVSILGTCAFWFLLWGVGLVVGILKPFHEAKALADWVWPTADGVRIALPRYKDLDKLNGQLIARDLLAKESNERKAIDREVKEIRWETSVAVTVGYIALFVGLACWRFNVKDY